MYYYSVDAGLSWKQTYSRIEVEDAFRACIGPLTVRDLRRGSLHPMRLWDWRRFGLWDNYLSNRGSRAYVLFPLSATGERVVLRLDGSQGEWHYWRGDDTLGVATPHLRALPSDHPLREFTRAVGWVL